MTAGAPVPEASLVVDVSIFDIALVKLVGSLNIKPNFTLSSKGEEISESDLLLVKLIAKILLAKVSNLRLGGFVVPFSSVVVKDSKSLSLCDSETKNFRFFAN